MKPVCAEFGSMISLTCDEHWPVHAARANVASVICELWAGDVRTYAGEILTGAPPAVIRNSMACSFDWAFYHLHVCVAAGIDADDHHCYTHQPTCA